MEAIIVELMKAIEGGKRKEKGRWHYQRKRKQKTEDEGGSNFLVLMRREKKEGGVKKLLVHMRDMQGFKRERGMSWVAKALRLSGPCGATRTQARRRKTERRGGEKRMHMQGSQARPAVPVDKNRPGMKREKSRGEGGSCTACDFWAA